VAACHRASRARCVQCCACAFGDSCTGDDYVTEKQWLRRAAFSAWRRITKADAASVDMALSHKNETKHRFCLEGEAVTVPVFNPQGSYNVFLVLFDLNSSVSSIFHHCPQNADAH